MHLRSKLVTFATQTKERAELLKNELENEQVSCYIEKPDYKEQQQKGIVKIRVKLQQYEKALAIAHKINKEHGREEIKIPEESLKIKKILSPVVFKPYSINAIYYAFEMAVKEQADLMLFHSYYNPFNNVTAYSEELGSSGYFDNNVYKIEETTRNKIEDIVKDLHEKSQERGININISYEVTGGSIYEQMICMTREYKPDLIVTGTKGKGKKNNDLVGRFTSKVIENNYVPVLAIPENTVFSEVDNLKILYLTRFDDSDFSALRNLMTYLEPFSPYVYCVHMGKKTDNPVIKDKMQHIASFFNKYYNQTNIEYEIIKGDNMLIALQEYIEKKQISMLSLSHHKKIKIIRLFESDITKKLLFYTQIPLLVFHS